MYLRSIQIENLRSLIRANLDFAFPGRTQDPAFEEVDEWPLRLPNVNLLIGMNGAGKTTILSGIALSVLSPIITQAGYVPYSLVRRGSASESHEAEVTADLVLHQQDMEGRSSPPPMTCEVTTTVRRRGTTEVLRGMNEGSPLWDGMFDERSPAFLLVGYGATRRVAGPSSSDAAERSKKRLPRYERVASLFEDQYALLPLTFWLPQMKTKNPGRYTQVVGLINKLLPSQTSLTGEIEAGEYLFSHRGLKVPFGALSDGYRAYIGWLSDLLYHVCMGCPSGKKLVDNKGVVLVDEIDLHIHPAWQQTMIPILARTLPNLQFIFTSHSPLVVGGLQRANIYHLHWGKSRQPKIRRPEEEVYGLSADQILRSEIFGLETTRAPAFTNHLERLARRANSGERNAAIEFMHQVAHGAGAIDDLADRPEWLDTYR